MRVKCPACGEIDHVLRVNRDVKVWENFQVEQRIDYLIEGGVEKPVPYYVVSYLEEEPPYIEEIDSNDLEFICECGYKFEEVTNEQDFIDEGLLQGWVIP